MATEPTDLSAAIAAVEAERERTAKRLASLDHALATLREISNPADGGAERAREEAAEDLSDLDRALRNASSLIEAAEAVLVHMGEMKAQAVADRIFESPFRYDQDRRTMMRSVASALARNAGSPGDPFTKVGHGIYKAARGSQNGKTSTSRATEDAAGHPVTGSIPDPVVSAQREKEASNTSLPFDDA